MGLRLRIMLVFLLMAGVSTVIVLAGVLFPLIGQYKQANAELAAAGRQSAQLAADFVADRRSDAEKVLQALTANEELAYRNHAAARALMARLSERAAGERRFVALDVRGRVVASSEQAEIDAFRRLPIVQAAREHEQPVWSDRLDWPGSGAPAVAVAARYKYYDRQGAHWGVVMVGCDLADWHAALNRQGAAVELFDKQGRRLVPPGDEAPASATRVEVAEALAGRQGSRQAETAVHAFAPVPQAGWAVVASAPAAETLLPIHRNIESAARMGLLALLVAGVLSFVLSGFLVAPIRRLETAASALARGEWELAEVAKGRLPEGQDELGRLTASFNLMATQLKNRFTSIEAEVGQRTRELERTNSQLTYAIRELKELDELKRAFLDAVSHELRTPLNFIMGYGSGLEDGLFGELTTDQRHALQRIMEGSERLLGVVDDLIEVSRLETGTPHLEPQAIDLPELFELAMRQLESAHRERGHMLRLEIEPQLPPAYADPERVGQILRQLLANAAKFTEPGGTITLSAQAVGDRLEIAVADTGVGIAPEALPHIWDAFRQGDGSMTRRHGGTGVGLTIVKRLIEAMDQRIEVESEPGGGSVFRFTLPVAAVSAEV